MRKFFAILCVLILLVSAFGCAGKEEALSTSVATPVPTPVQTPVPTPEPPIVAEPEPVSFNEIAFKNRFNALVDFSFLEASIEFADKDYTVLAANTAFFEELKTKFETELKAAASLAAMQQGFDMQTEVFGLSGFMMMSMSPHLAQMENFSMDMLPHSFFIGEEKVILHFDFSDNQALFSGLSGDDMEKYLNLRVRYGYMLTVYDADGNRLDGSQEKLDLEWLFPLPKYTRFRDTWFADRDKGKRRHLGTDISAPEGTEIYSCTDATVIYIGTGTLAGNCVYTRDDDGHEYMYCHMVKITDFLKVGDRVKTGDVVGYVGNTGNSSVNHLHLTVILNDARHLHTFPYLKEAWDAGRVKKEA
ncbi:MAG: M23 family metallopeptidase [Clostridiales bacterium]|nr:M23 family metallopeptidase [Clostridiales bacterium]